MIFTAIKKCRAVIVVMNQKFCSSDFCRAELEAALTYNKVVIPVMCKGFDGQQRKRHECTAWVKHLQYVTFDPKWVSDKTAQPEDPLFVQNFDKMCMSIATHGIHPVRSYRTRQTFIFPIEDLHTATDDFAEANVIGAGQFGVVYRGFVRGQAVAVKKLRAVSLSLAEESPPQDRGSKSFSRELKALSNIRCPNVVPFLGATVMAPYCLVFTLMEHGNVREWLDGEKPERL